MKIFVEVLCELDPTLSLRVDRATGEASADPGDSLYRVNPACSAAVDLAVKLAATLGPEVGTDDAAGRFRALGGDVTAFTLGTGHDAALHDALARGAKQAIVVTDVDGQPPTPGQQATWLAEQGARLTFMGRSAGPVASRLGWSHLALIDDVHVVDGRLSAHRNLGRGDQEKVQAELPAVVRLELACRPIYIARKRLAAARSHALTKVELPKAEPIAGITPGALAPAKVRTRLGAAAAPAPASMSGSSRLQSLMGQGAAKKPAAAAPTPSREKPTSPEAMAESFVRYLAHHNLLPKRS